MKWYGLAAAPLLIGVLFAFRGPPARQAPAFTVPEGFAVEEVYAPEKARSVVAMTFDSRGRLVIAREDGPVVTLFDHDGDGAIDAELAITDQLTNSQGLFFDGPDLLSVAMGPQGAGLYRVVDGNGDARGERVELMERAIGGIHGHGPHAVFFGPDGYLYWTQGNGTGIHSRFAPLSPLREYDEGSLNGRCDPRGHACSWRAPGGTFLRTALPSGTDAAPAALEWELFAGGFRNQYDGAFNLLGELFTFDSDMEWDRDLPWYKPTSAVHVLPGGDHGWRSGSMNHPWHYPDVLPPTAELGRGSPTGVHVLHSYNYPAKYWDMVLQSDWSRGRVIGGRLTKNGATYAQDSSTFIYGEPLNVTDLEVGPDGNVYFVLGGRQTQGGVYRVVYRGPDAMQKPRVERPLDRVLTMIQPRSAFSRQLARDVKAQMGERAWRRALVAEIRNTAATPQRRVRAIELLQVFGPTPDEALLAPLRDDPSWEVRAASTYHLGLSPTGSSRAELVARLADSDPFVQRRAAEALLRTGVNPAVRPPFSPVTDVLPLLSSPDRFVRYQARSLLRATNPNLWQQAALTVDGYPQAPEALMALVQTLDDPRVTDVSRLLARELELLRANPSEPELLQLVRVIQRTVLEDQGVSSHNVAEFLRAPAAAPRGQRQNTNGYAAIGELLLARFPAADTSLSREIARTVAYLGTPGAIQKIAGELQDSNTSRTQQIFYADQLSYVENGWDDASVEQMTTWLESAYRGGWRGGASFSGYIDYIRDAFLTNVPAETYARVSERLRAAQPQLATRLPALAGGAAQPTVSDEELFEELVYNPNITQGTPAGGVSAYEKAGCIACHTFGRIGTEFGPDLTTVRQRFGRRDLVRAVVFPHETIADLWKVEEITRTDGQKVSGTIYREDADVVVVSVAGSQQVTVPKGQIRSRLRSQRSAMPEGLLNGLSSQERRNLFLLLEAGPAAVPDSALRRLGIDG